MSFLAKLNKHQFRAYLLATTQLKQHTTTNTLCDIKKYLQAAKKIFKTMTYFCICFCKIVFHASVNSNIHMISNRLIKVKLSQRGYKKEKFLK